MSSRRDFITLLGGAAAWPLAASAQEPMPVVGFLSTRAAGEDVDLIAAFHHGLKETGYVVHQNMAITYRFANNQYDRLPELAGDLVRSRVNVIVAAGSPAALVAKAATTRIPVVFAIGFDPVATGLVASLNRPGGNLTGLTALGTDLGPKRLELLREFVPRATTIAALLNPSTPAVETQFKDLQASADTLNVQIQLIEASTEFEFDSVFEKVARLKAGALVIGNDPFFNTSSERLGALTLRHAIPAIYQFRPFSAAGGLMSYGSNIRDNYRQVGVYAGRVLKGDKPADLPVQQATKVELIVNLKTAKTLGLTVPLPLLARADEVIE
jgi:putative ABC transport system substrate-binding protein